MSIILFTEIHALSHGDGNGSRFFAARRPPKWHMLSYATNIFDQLAGFELLRMRKSHDRTIIKACEGLSDLKYKGSETLGKYCCLDNAMAGSGQFPVP